MKFIIFLFALMLQPLLSLGSAGEARKIASVSTVKILKCTGYHWKSAMHSDSFKRKCSKARITTRDGVIVAE